MFRTKFVEKIKTHFMFNNNFFPQKNRTVYEIMWINTIQPDRPHIIKYDAENMEIACRKTATIIQKYTRNI
jgi:hypothetical protein